MRLFWHKTDILSNVYAAMDNFRLVASDISGDIGNASTTEPSGIIGLGILGSGLVVRRVAKCR
ncbi:MAG: PEP-CTERM sorting domain-containing protein [Microcystis wesenbergii Mw_QC_S_20081001_S30D]|uniref:PEP-CTERM sorting domain-containing protein n=1 Tax=Microcystis wesenbergii Mw_QC_S_20081001_S30D TaxID=2486245 RepID=A0A552JB64_9CHRO|nr:PEP-CTERM sorting domain-containing protein [Microcystis aeruginosa W11-03]NCR92864.1 PEP-CTERM sorting domain-containing protein [Microcystis aeruginosa W11-06]TRU92764.1 MAG: PEP-CTERM sorting domain-containing protein [Microcystis wesenbergii Mw_QC_S_20081001_S30D]TRU96650.1 MAG: PEP-CTERM sorting domain-containing protein [Microcystis wesenbergii Mw_QC_B_20070930_S4D]TRV02306.1 MAG: PEP-CTERM sorting domain-containing protein [Microcystis wesenbergii Mw_QC_S_20081001_S30]TRV08745.1 MAG: